MEMIFNHMPAEYYADKKISANAKLVLQRLFTLSKDGTQPVYAQRKFLANSLGISMRTVSSVFKELEDNNYIQETENTNSYDRTRNFILTCKSCKKGIATVATIKETVSRGYCESCKGGIATVATSSLDRSKERNKLEEERGTHSLSFDFNSIFSAMNEIKNEFTDYVFTDEEIKENAQSYLDKSQGYKFYKGKPTEAKLKAWLTQYLKQKKEKTSVVSGSGDLAKRLSAMNQINEMMSERSHTEKKSDPIDADFEIIDEQKNALA